MLPRCCALGRRRLEGEAECLCNDTRIQHLHSNVTVAAFGSAWAKIHPAQCDLVIGMLQGGIPGETRRRHTQIGISGYGHYQSRSHTVNVSDAAVWQTLLATCNSSDPPPGSPSCLPACARHELRRGGPWRPSLRVSAHLSRWEPHRGSVKPTRFAAVSVGGGVDGSGFRMKRVSHGKNGRSWRCSPGTRDEEVFDFTPRFSNMQLQYPNPSPGVGLSSELVKPSGAHPTAANAVGRYRYILGSHPKCRIPSSRDRILDISTGTARWRLVAAVCRQSEPGSQHQLMSLAVANKSCRVRADGITEHTHFGAHHGGAYRDRGGLGTALSQSNSQLPIRGPKKGGRRQKNWETLSGGVWLLLCCLPTSARRQCVPCAVVSSISYAKLWIGSRICCSVQTLVPELATQPGSWRLGNGVVVYTC